LSSRLCYLARLDRGDQIAAVRLVGQQTDEVWLPDAAPVESVEASAVVEAARAGAAWVAERLKGSGWLDVVCLDGQGVACSWLTAPSAAAPVVEAAFAQTGGGALGGVDAQTGPVEGGLTVQALGEPGTTTAKGRKRAAEGEAGQRMAVLAAHDTSVRLFLDALDDLGIGVGRVVSLWHAMAEAWDRSAEAGPRSERIVATEAPMVAVVLADPAGRLAWVWSRGGRVITGGSLRLARLESADNGNGHSSVMVGGPDVGRLTTDWLSWAAQLGRAPSRVVCIVPALSEGGLTAAPLGEALGRAWPTATVDLVVHEDPVGATLGRLVRSEDEGEHTGSLDRLTRRPSRAHRSLHLWGAVALAALAGGLGVVAARLGGAAATLRAQRAEVENGIRSVVVEAVPDLASSAWIERDFQARIDGMKGPGVQEGVGDRPVLAELESVFGLLMDFRDAGVEPLDIYLDENMVSKVDVSIPSSGVGEDLLGSAQGMPSEMIWTGKFGNAIGEGRQRYSLLATWPKPGGGR
jgi:hypothetical protein